jgi:hypothetical protein
MDARVDHLNREDLGDLCDPRNALPARFARVPCLPYSMPATSSPRAV